MSHEVRVAGHLDDFRVAAGIDLLEAVCKASGSSPCNFV